MAMRAPPATAYFKGTIEGSPGSAVLLAIRADRAMHGTAFQGTKTWALGVSAAAMLSAPQAAAIGGGAAARALTSRLVGPTETSGKGAFSCGYEPSLAGLAGRLQGDSTTLNASAPAAAAAGPKVGCWAPRVVPAGCSGWPQCPAAAASLMPLGARPTARCSPQT